MSIENAIADHAAAIRELAAAIRGAASSNLATAGALTTMADLTTQNERAAEAEVEAADSKVEADAKAKQQAVMAAVEADRKPTAARAAIEDALAKARAEKAKPAAEDDIPPELGATSLDWDKDVRPALLAVGKDRDALVKLMGKYEVPKGGKAPTEKWADLLAEANAIVAARG